MVSLAETTAVILAGGRGSRLLEEAKIHFKPGKFCLVNI